MADQRKWILLDPDGEEVGSMTTTADQVRLIGAVERDRLSAAQTVLADLDRCVHGRHAGDVCNSCGGPSVGNQLLTPSQRIGTDLSGRPITVPTGRDFYDPAAWVV